MSVETKTEARVKLHGSRPQNAEQRLGIVVNRSLFCYSSTDTENFLRSILKNVCSNYNASFITL